MQKNMLEWRLSERFQVAMVWEGVLVGLLAGCIVTFYRIALTQAERLMRTFTEGAVGHPTLIALWFAILLLILLVVSALMLWEPYTVGSGIPQVDVEVMGHINQKWHRVIGAKFVEGTLLSLAGLSLGREGPAVQLGGMSGKAISRLLKRGRGEERILITCGAASGMAAAFHAPLTGVMFAIEEIHKTFSAPLVISVMVSCVCSDYFVSQVLGVDPVLSFTLAGALPHSTYYVLIIMGAVMGVLGALHNQGMFLAQKLYSRIQKRVPYARLAIPFAVAGVMAFTFPILCCGGGAIAQLLETLQRQPMSLLVMLLLGKYLFTTICFGSGAPGGTLFPLVIMGMIAGDMFGQVVCPQMGLDPSFVTNFLVLGIAGLFSGVVRAPVTAAVLVFELTGSFDALLSVSIVSIAAYVTANLLKSDPFYERLVNNMLGTTEAERDYKFQSGEKILHTYIVGAGSFAEGRTIGDLRWPESSLCITLTRSGREMVPNGETEIYALDRLLVIMDIKNEDECDFRLRALTHGTIGYGGR
ncbi:MAG: chloride channel protein [Atopobiaceae bacterium]